MEEMIAQIAQLLSQAQQLLGQLVEAQAPQEPQAPAPGPGGGEQIAARAGEGL